MPTTIPLGFRGMNAGLTRSIPATTRSLDFIIVTCFAVIGVLLAIWFASFPPSTDVVALMASVS